MRLSAVDIFGFKSFPHRTRVDFGPGISAVVGPNGCGKSNLSDAVRWALGEQSAKSLRGDVMEDLIFNGTADTPPLSMAEVSLTFTDVQGYLSVEADELVVTRRMYRSGESHYYLNKQPVRLKDVRDMFADTGLGKASYAVVEQGMVEAIVKAKADERREFFEEAAGIRGYRAKRAEAMRKLDDVQANMERLEDLYDEYKRRARALKRQAGAARRYQGLVDRHRDLEIGLARLGYKAKSEQKRAALAGRDEFRTAHREARARTTNADAEVSRLDAEIARLELELERREKDLLGRQRGVNEAEAAKQLAEERGRAAAEEVARLTAERDRLEAELARADEENRRIDEELAAARAQAAEREERRTRVAEQLAEIREREAELAETLEAVRAEQMRRLHDRTQLANLFATASAARKSHAGELARLREEAGRQSSLFDEKYASLSKLTEELASLERELTGCREAAGRLETSEKRLVGELALAEAAVVEVRTRREKAGSRLASLEELARRFESFETGVKALMENGRPEGIGGLLAEAVRVEPGYEAAAERALGYAAGAVLARDLPTATAYGRRLKEDGIGRAAFLIPGNGAGNPGDLPVVEGVRGWASDFVRIEGEYAGAAAALLRNVLVVEDLTALEAVVEVYPHSPAVTLDGDWWDGRAVLMAGSAEDVSATILGRRAEIDKLAAAVENLDRELSAKRHDVGRLTTEREETGRRKQENAERAVRLDAACENARGALSRAHDESRSLEESRGLIEAEIAGAENRLADAFEDEERLGGQLHGTELACEEAAASVEEADREMQELRGRVAALEREAADVREDVATLREKTKALTGGRERLARFKVEGTERLETLAGGREKKAGEAAELAEEITECEAEIAERRNVFQEAEGGVKELRLVRAELAARRREAEETRAAAEGAAEEVADSLKEKEIQVASLTGELNALDESVAAKYGVRLSTLGPDEYAIEGDVEEATAEKEALARKLGKMGEVNFLAAREYDELAASIAELEGQRDDLARARSDLDESIARIDGQSREKFVATFDQVRTDFQEIFKAAFGGGQADLRLQPGVDPLDAGIYVYAQPPGKKMEHLTLLSGGEKALAAIALIFALFNARPAPFAILDEVDAPLDENNIGRFLKLVASYRGRVQFMVITHARRTMEESDAIYGVTMERRGISKVLSLKFEEVPEEYLELAGAAS
ncbi:MAG: chromosome segregation protein SMC [Candidatus Zixiibacteriota bacterium]|jgi:chromosome segregation protein